MSTFQRILWIISAIGALFGALVFAVGLMSPAAAIAFAAIPLCFAYTMSEISK